jgi:hypothetical protein
MRQRGKYHIWIAASLLSDPGGVLIARHSAIRTAAFRNTHNVGFYLVSQVYPVTTMSTISGLSHTACNLAKSGFPSAAGLPGLPADFATDLLAKLWSGGTLTVCDHPLGNIIEFHGLTSNPIDLDLSYRECLACLPQQFQKIRITFRLHLQILKFKAAEYHSNIVAVVVQTDFRKS